MLSRRLTLSATKKRSVYQNRQIKPANKMRYAIAPTISSKCLSTESRKKPENISFDKKIEPLKIPEILNELKEIEKKKLEYTQSLVNGMMIGVVLSSGFCYFFV